MNESKFTQINKLFRQEAVEHRSTASLLGPLLICLPLSHEILAWLLLVILISVSGWVVLGAYQEKTKVQGYIDLKPGFIQVYPKSPGILKRSLVQVGQVVKQGEVLFEVQTSMEGKSPLQTTLNEYSTVITQLEGEIEKKRSLLPKYKSLVEQHYLSPHEYEQHVTALRQLQQEAAQLKMNHLHSQLEYAYVVTAPIDGTVSQIEVQTGQWVSGEHALMKLRPHDSHWVGYLLVPVKSMRFVQPQREVTLRYDAYPFLQYGVRTGKIKARPRALAEVAQVKVPVPMHDPFYLVEVSLVSPHLRWREKVLPLYQGMTLEGVLKGEKQPLWKWLRLYA